MTGKWFYLAIAVLSGLLLSLELQLFSFLFILLAVIRLILEKDRQLFIVFCTVLILFTIVGEHSKKRKASKYLAGQTQLDITFKEFPQIDGDRLRAVIITPHQEKLLFSYKISSEIGKSELSKKLRAGVSCRVSGELVQPEKNRNEHAFNYQQYLYSQNIHWIFEANEFRVGRCLNKGNIISKLRNLRASGIKNIEENFPAETIPYASALIFGDQTAFSEEVYTAYKRIGVVHLLAISGLHIGLMAGGLHFMLIRIGLSREAVFLFLICFLPIYAVLSGGNPPVVRAVLMAVLLLFAKKWRLPLTTLDAFSISFLVFLFFDPYLIYHAGFQLSYSVSFALIMSSERILSKISSFIHQMAEISILSMLASLPILSYHFYEFSIISIIANILFVPFYSIIILPAMLILFFLQFIHHQLFALLIHWTSHLINLSERVATAASSFKFTMLITGKPDGLGIICMLIGVSVYMLFKERRRNTAIAALPLILVLIFQSAMIKYSPLGEVIFIDVGQGDSILIKLPYNRGIYLIDTGGRIEFPVEEWQRRRKSFRVGDDVLLPLLKSKGISKIDKLILTHNDADHMGAASELLGKIKIEEIYISPNASKKQLMAELIDSAQLSGIKVIEVKAGMGWENKTGKFQIIFPFADRYEGNNDSLVLYGVFGGLKWLFTGDAEKEAEEDMIRHYGRLDIDVLKVGHHGSRSSTTPEMIEFTTPAYAIISAGKNNRYGHPHPEVLEVLEQHQIRVFRTDAQGAVHYLFRNNSGTFRTILQYDKAIPR